VNRDGIAWIQIWRRSGDERCLEMMNNNWTMEAPEGQKAVMIVKPRDSMEQGLRKTSETSFLHGGLQVLGFGACPAWVSLPIMPRV
jgi:hypothetical protein